MSTKRNELWQENPLAVRLMDVILMELIVTPNIQKVNPNYSREHILKVLWHAIEEGKLEIYYNQNDGIISFDLFNITLEQLLGGEYYENQKF